MKQKLRVGIDIGGTNVKVGIFTTENELLAKERFKTRPHDRSAEEVVRDMAALTETLLLQQGATGDDLEKIGIGSPGMIDHKNGVVNYAGNFGWHNVAVVAEMARYFPKTPIRLSNDANCAVLGECVAGAAKGCQDVVMITLGTGIGGGVVAGGVLQEGGHAGGMELGHTLLVMGGEACTCGRLGCLEAYTSATGIIRHTREAALANPLSKIHEACGGDLEAVSGRTAFLAMKEGDAVAADVVERYIQALGEGIINFINIWRPEKVLVGGGMSNEGDALMLPLNDYVKWRTFAGKQAVVPPIERAVLGNDAGLYGAAAL